MQKVILIGHLGRDPEVKYTQQGTAIAQFSVATERRSTFPTVPCRRNLNRRRLDFDCVCDMRVDLGPEALWISALCGIWANRKSFLLTPRRHARQSGRYPFGSEPPSM